MSTDQIEGRRPVLEALRAGRQINEILLARGAHTSGVLGEIARLADRQAIPVRLLPRREIEARAQSRTPQGVIALATGFGYTSLSQLLAHADGESEPLLIVALDGVTDPQNLGALGRSAEAAGCHGIVVPRRRAAPVTPAAAKAAAGALEHLPVAQVPNLPRALAELKDRGAWIVALDASAEKTIYDLSVSDQPLCLVVGGEEGGVSRLVRERADLVVRIPMAGRISSLNAAAAGAVALFEIRRRRDGRASDPPQS